MGGSTIGSRPGLALVVIACAQLMAGLDATIVNVALPHAQRAIRHKRAIEAGRADRPVGWPSALASI